MLGFVAGGLSLVVCGDLLCCDSCLVGGGAGLGIGYDLLLGLLFLLWFGFWFGCCLRLWVVVGVLIVLCSFYSFCYFRYVCICRFGLMFLVCGFCVLCRFAYCCGLEFFALVSPAV